ncbi:ethanolamine ammonia-lyase subunit EutC [uncultured Methylobacterium sp.]|uniref:ethanolamine ammonia-lyase subunit EutC n=1 Tax=uncultured Methylobacterium sp. TaxID=157278 RepID=UPI0035CB343D
MTGEDPWARLQRLTPARIGLGRAGAGLPTIEVLRFGLAHAQARDAVHTPMNSAEVAAGIEALGFPTVIVSSAAPDRATYLRRPDLGRALSDESQDALVALMGEPVDLAIVVADGLSARAVHEGSAGFLAAFKPHIEKAGWTLAPVAVATQGRVALGDGVGAALKARAVVVLIGERPGLSSPDSLGLYLTFAPRIGRSDAERNCISNVRPAGLSHERAALTLDWLLREAFVRGITGVGLKDGSGAVLAGPEAAPTLEQAGGAGPS